MAGTLIVALDLDTRGEAEALVDRLGEAVDFYKIGYQLIYGGDGLAFGKALIAAGKRIFFDLKLLDIDNTVEKGAAAIAQTGATMLTVHAYPQCMRAAQKATAGSGLTIPGGAGAGCRTRRAGLFTARGRNGAIDRRTEACDRDPGYSACRQRHGRPEAGDGAGGGDCGGGDASGRRPPDHRRRRSEARGT